MSFYLRFQLFRLTIQLSFNTGWEGLYQVVLQYNPGFANQKTFSIGISKVYRSLVIQWCKTYKFSLFCLALSLVSFFTFFMIGK